MADLLSKDMFVDLIINIINIIVLFLVTRALLYKPVKKYLDARKTRIEAADNEAKQAQSDAESEKARYEAVVASADSIKQRAAEEARKEASDEAQKIIDAAKEQARVSLEKSRDEQKLEHDKMLAASKDEIVDIALQISGKVLNRTVTDADNRKIIDSFFAQ